MSNRYTDEMFGQERSRASVVWHMLTNGSHGDWKALCGSEEACDSENHLHSLTNRLERVTCEKCREIAEKEKTK